MKSFIYKIRKGLWPKLAILCYHRIGDYKSDPVKITVSNENFLKQIEYIKNFAEIIHPDQLFDSLNNRKNLPKRSILLTFDDGYSSYKQTMNILFDKSISAIFFLSSRKEKFWWDILSKILFENESINNNDYQTITSLLFNLGYEFEIEKHIKSDSMNSLSKWDVTNNYFPFNRNKAFYLIANKMENIDNYNNEMFKMVSSLSKNERNFNYLSDRKLIDYHRIGYHTTNHLNLSKLDFDSQRKEIELGKKEFESFINKQINIFAYPFGTRNHYNEDTLKIVKSNFSFAFSNFHGLVHKDSNIFELPRFLIRDWPIDEFKHRVKSFFNK